MVDSHRTNRLKSLLLPRQTRRHVPQPLESTPVLPSPNVPFHGRRPHLHSENETAAGEPLVQDFATHSIPKEYKPFMAKDSDTNSLDLPMQRPPTVVIRNEDANEQPNLIHSNRKETQYSTRPSRFVRSLNW